MILNLNIDFDREKFKTRSEFLLEKMKLKLLNTDGGLKPMYDDDYEEKKKLKRGQVYVASISVFRNVGLHRKYFSLINCAWEYLTEPQQEFYHKNKEYFRKSLEVSAGYCDTIYNHKLGSFVDIPKSVAFDKMDESEFQDLYRDVKYIINNIILTHISEEEFERGLANF